MASFFERSTSLWQSLKGSPATLRTRISIDRDHVDVGAKLGPVLKRHEHYFLVRVNEMFLSSGRQWFTTVDPLVAVVTEFMYEKEFKAVPFVVGPTLLESKQVKTPTGMTFSNTRVAGIHPYRGDRLAITVILYRLPRDNHARAMLDLVQRSASALDFSGALATYLKVADALLGGVESVLKISGTEAIMGHRFEVDPDGGDTLEAGYHAIIDLPPGEIDVARLWVRGNALVEGDSLESAKPFTRGDFVLYSLKSDEQRSDIERLPFYPSWEVVEREANTALAPAWENAKVNLASLILSMRESPDLTRRHCDALVEELTDRAVALHEKAVSRSQLSGGGRAPRGAVPASVRNEALAVLNL